MAEDASEWSLAALTSAPRRRTTTVAGAEIAYSSWGQPGGDVLVHGGAGRPIVSVRAAPFDWQERPR